MTRVGSVGQAPPAAWGGGGRTTAGGFSLRAEAGPAAPGLTAVGSVAIPGMLALQEAETDAGRDREARRHGRAVLEELAGLQRALLAGRADPAALHRLAALAKTAPDAADPRLRAVLRAVALRAKVELARLGPAAG